MEPVSGSGELKEKVTGSAMDLVLVTDLVLAMGSVKGEPSETESDVLLV